MSDKFMSFIDSYFKIDEERGRSEFTANHQLAGSAASSGEHHVYIKTRGKKKSIAGPFKSKEEAENHASRKFGDGVATKQELDH